MTRAPAPFNLHPPAPTSGRTASAEATSPAAVDVERNRCVTITWEDGHVSSFELRPLRLACPCAGCRSDWAADREPMVPAELSITEVDLAGAWGMTPTWNDGHTSGIYSWASLREGCPCQPCGNRP
ncbi:MAG: hypothetical protein NVS3B21_17300 [Acidimicrobiales bacterium]